MEEEKCCKGYHYVNKQNRYMVGKLNTFKYCINMKLLAVVWLHKRMSLFLGNSEAEVFTHKGP